MPDNLTNFQIAMLCAVEEHDHADATDEQRRDLEILISGEYVRPTSGHPGEAFQLTAKGVAFLGERGAGLNEA